MGSKSLSADVRWLVVGAPSYLARFAAPVHPADLQAHRCVKIRIGDESIYRWEFERGEEKLEVNVPGGLTVDQGHIGLVAVRDGAGLMYVSEPMVRKDLRDGTLRTVLDDWAPLGAGFHIYYSSRRQVPAALRLFIDLVRELRPLGL